MEPENAKDRFAVAALNDEEIVGHLMKGRTGRFAKTIFYFLRADTDNKCQIEISGRPANEGDRKGMKVPCILHLIGKHYFVKILEDELCKHM